MEDVKRIRAHPLVPKRIPIYGFYFDVKTGLLVPVPEATEAGKATVLCRSFARTWVKVSMMADRQGLPFSDKSSNKAFDFLKCNQNKFNE